MTDTSGLKFDAVTRFIVSASGLHGAEYNREYERVYKIVANFALQQAKEHHATATAAMKIIESEREAAVAKLVEALEGIVALDVANVGLMRGMLINPSDERDYYSPLANIARSALDEFHGRKQG